MPSNQRNKVVPENKSEQQQYEARMGDALARLQYRLAGDTIIFTHAEVPRAFEGQGIASKLTQTALEDARERGLWVVPLCPFVADYIRQHPAYHSLVHSEYRDRVTS